MNPDTDQHRPRRTRPPATRTARPQHRRPAVTVTEIAEFLSHLRALSQPGAADPTRDTTAERAAFLARKAELFTRIAADPARPPSPPSPTGGDPT